MPIYEYQCKACGHHLEALQSISDEPLRECPACAQPALKKLISAAGFRLKGGGWYETDFKKSGKRNVASSSDATQSKDGDSGSSGDSGSGSTKTADAS